jgi:hypothetical protein
MLRLYVHYVSFMLLATHRYSTERAAMGCFLLQRVTEDWQYFCFHVLNVE